MLKNSSLSFPLECLWAGKSEARSVRESKPKGKVGRVGKSVCVKTLFLHTAHLSNYVEAYLKFFMMSVMLIVLETILWHLGKWDDQYVLFQKFLSSGPVVWTNLEEEPTLDTVKIFI